MGKFAEAEKLLTSVLKENIKSSNQTEEFITKHAFTRLLLEQSQYKEALAIFQTILGDEDISEISDEVVLAAWHNYGNLLMNMGQLSEAYNILRDVLKRTKEICDPENYDISNTRMIMAAILRKQGRYTKALELYDEIVYDRTQSLGECHFKTLMAKESSALVLIKQQRFDEALLIYYDVFEKLKRALGESHPEVLTTRANIAGALNNKGEREKAYEIYTDVYQKFKVILGEKCKKIETTTKNNTVENIQGYEKKWPLHHAAINDFVIAAKLLLMAGASYCEKDCNGKTPLQLTSNERIRYWLNLTKRLFRCVRNGNNFDLWKYIAVVNAKDGNGYSPLHSIAYHGNHSALRQILETPWHLARDPLIYEILNDIHDLFSCIKDGNEGAVINLGRKGYDEIEAITGARNSQDHTLLQVAIMNNHRGIAGKLIKIMKESDGNGRR
ncbi:hypothetical protein TNCV_3112951 [Trichonephila clavipes]|nr:hypothetical protein TNCV_3112951 [Trichonephila clavipes]